MKICLYIPCRNGATTLPEVFAAVHRQTRAPDQRLLVDDQSTDATGDLARAAGWTVISTSADRNGLSVARNLAVAATHAAGCDVIAGLDADAVPSPSYVEELERFYQTHPEVVGTCGNMRERYAVSPSDLWRAVYMRQHWGDDPLENPPILFGSSAAHRLEIVRRAGGYNEDLRTNFEDTDLTQRLLRAGHRLAYVPSLVSEHLKRDTPDSVLRMFWNWYRPAADLAGHFHDVGTWLQHRHPWIWQDFASRMTGDASLPRLTAITAALPWSQVMRDVHLLAERSGRAVDLRPVVELAKAVHEAHGYGAEFILWLSTRLENVLKQCETSVMESLNPLVFSQLRECALRAIPRRGYWHDIDLSIGDLSSSTAAASNSVSGTVV